LENQLLVWELPLSQHGSALMQRRRDLTRRLGDFAESALRDLTGGLEKFEVQYEPQLEGGEKGEELTKRLLEALQKSRREDMVRSATGVGPHRDDLGLFVNGKPLRKFGSQGQQRTGALALKLAQLSILAEGCQKEPLILFDDVMAELDEKRRAYFLNKLQGGGQAFLTGTSRTDFLGAGTRARVFKVEEGTVETRL
jgi:DNA replication and repair protein RecF